MIDREQGSYADLSSGRIWYRVYGGGDATPIIVVHGGPAQSHDYLLSLKALSVLRPICFYDQYGSGRSPAEKHAHTFDVDHFTRELEALQHYLGWPTAVVLGHSWGAVPALHYACENPAKVAGLILASPLICSADYARQAREYAQKLEPKHAEAVDIATIYAKYGTSAFRQALIAYAARHLCNPEAQTAEFSESSTLMNWALYEHLWGESEFLCNGLLQRLDLKSALAQVQVPTLLTCGDRDPVSPSILQSYVKVMSAQTSVKVFPGCSHNPQLEAQTHYLQVVETFLATVAESLI